MVAKICFLSFLFEPEGIDLMEDALKMHGDTQAQSPTNHSQIKERPPKSKAPKLILVSYGAFIFDRRSIYGISVGRVYIYRPQCLHLTVSTAVCKCRAKRRRHRIQIASHYSPTPRDGQRGLVPLCIFRKSANFMQFRNVVRRIFETPDVVKGSVGQKKKVVCRWKKLLLPDFFFL